MDNATKSADENFCKSCGQVIKKEAEICPKCGVRQQAAVNLQAAAGKSWVTALVICILLGPIGGHRFYTGHTGIGVLQLLTFGGCGIWFLVDLISILCGSFKDAQGNLLVK